MKINLRNICLVLFAITIVGDVATTLIIKFKHPIFNEANPLYIFGASIWVLVALIVVLKGYLLWFLLKRYHKIDRIFIRYWIVYFVVLMVFLGFGAIISNIRVINTPSDQIVQGTPEQNLEVYVEQVGDVKLIENLAPPINTSKGPVKVPFMVLLVIMNVLQFLVWQSFEVNSWRKDE